MNPETQPSESTPPKSLAQIAYEGYCASSGGVSLVSGQPLPGWDNLSEPIKAAWKSASDAVQGAGKLETIFSLQKELNKRSGVFTDNLSEDKQQEWLRNYSLAMTQEIAELVDCTKWKWWGKYQTFDKQNAKVEVVDMLHFLVSLAQVLGMTAEDFYDAYIQKNIVNHKRQDTGYVTKDATDCKHI